LQWLLLFSDLSTLPFLSKIFLLLRQKMHSGSEQDTCVPELVLTFPVWVNVLYMMTRVKNQDLIVKGFPAISRESKGDLQKGTP
jgi:hypothetical protein